MPVCGLIPPYPYQGVPSWFWGSQDDDDIKSKTLNKSWWLHGFMQNRTIIYSNSIYYARHYKKRYTIFNFYENTVSNTYENLLHWTHLVLIWCCYSDNERHKQWTYMWLFMCIIDGIKNFWFKPTDIHLSLSRESTSPGVDLIICRFYDCGRISTAYIFNFDSC